MNTLFVPVAEIDLTQYPAANVAFQMKKEGNKLVVYMAVTPVPIMQKPLP